MKKESRFFVSNSVLYGTTVYDRTTNSPAFEYGADVKMDNCSANVLSAKLNRGAELVAKLDFDGCIRAFDALPKGNPITLLVFDRMEILDPKRYENFLNS